MKISYTNQKILLKLGIVEEILLKDDLLLNTFHGIWLLV